MKIAAFETSGKIGSVALLDDERSLGVAEFERGMVHGRELVPALDRLLRAAGWSIEDLDLFAVSQGPGSYTGVRVGIATARTLAWATGKRLLGVCTLDVLASNARPQPAYFCPAIDARWEQVYAGLYRAGTPGPERTSEPMACRPEELIARLAPGTVVFGSALERFGAAFLAAGCVPGDPAWATPHAEQVARLALARARMGASDDPHTLAPLYLRPTEAEVKFGVVKLGPATAP